MSPIRQNNNNNPNVIQIYIDRNFLVNEWNQRIRQYQNIQNEEEQDGLLVNAENNIDEHEWDDEQDR